MYEASTCSIIYSPVAFGLLLEGEVGEVVDLVGARGEDANHVHTGGRIGLLSRRRSDGRARGSSRGGLGSGLGSSSKATTTATTTSTVGIQGTDAVKITIG